MVNWKSTLKNRLWMYSENHHLFKKYRVKKRLNKNVFQFRLNQDDIDAGLEDDKKKKEILKKHRQQFPLKFDEISTKADEVLNKYHEKELNTEVTKQDILFCYFAYGFSPNEYLCYELFAKNTADRKLYMSDRDSICLAYQLNDIDFINIFMDKAQTYNKFGKYYKRDAIQLRDKKDYQQFKSFTKKHPVFVKKIVDESCGRSIELIHVNPNGQKIKELFETFLQQGKIILEECIEQGKKMSQLNASSVNTIRCITMNTKHGIIIPYCFLKVGREGSFVDNGGAGGILVGIDVTSGVLCTDGYDEVNTCYEEHPESRIKFKGYHLPEWDSILSICREMAGKIPQVGWIGWDMAYTDTKGWVVVEGNALSEVIGPQTTMKRGIREEIKKYIKDMKIYN